MKRLREAVNGILNAQADPELRCEGFVHLYGVSQTAVLLAHIRGLDAQLCAAAGLLHDIYTFRTGGEAGHAIHGAADAGDLLKSLGCFEDGETSQICRAILRHSDKQTVDGAMEECLKDADVLSHWLYDPHKKFEQPKKARLERVMGELGFEGEVRGE
jgi:HD superfamily phosphodiesterase